MMIKALKALAIALPMAAAALVVAPGSANADLGDCRRGSFCAWSEDGFQGRLASWRRGKNSRQWVLKRMHDDADSLFNNARSSTTVRDNVRVYNDINFKRPGVCVQPGETFDAGMNDNDYDSHRWVHSC